MSALVTSPAPDSASPPPPRPFEPMRLPALTARPLVSVLMTSYNYANFIGCAIRSVLDQTYDHFELIVVDDGSTDGSPAVIRGIAEHDARITLIEQPNQGMAAALNTGFERSRGEVITLLDADDAYEPDKLETVVDRFRREPQVGMLQHPLQVVDHEDKPLQVIPFLSKLEHGWLGPTLLRRGGRWSFMPTSALSYRLEVAKCLIPIEPDRYRISADALLYTVGPLLTRVGVIDRTLAHYRVHGSNHMSSGAVDRAEIRKRISSYHDTIVGSNRHSAGLGLSLPQFDPRDHLLYREQLFVLSMLRGRRRGWVGRFFGLIGAMVRDDMYGTPQKLLAIPVYGLLPLMPRRWRGPWLDRVRMYGRVKGLAQFVMNLTKRRVEAPPEKAGRLHADDVSDESLENQNHQDKLDRASPATRISESHDR